MNNESPGIGFTAFKLTFDKNFKSESYSLNVVTKPKKQFGLRRVRGFLRIVDIGYSYIVKVVK